MTEPVRQLRPFLAIELLACIIVVTLSGMEMMQLYQQHHPDTGFVHIDGLVYPALIGSGIVSIAVWLPLTGRASRLRLGERALLTVAGGLVMYFGLVAHGGRADAAYYGKNPAPANLPCALVFLTTVVALLFRERRRTLDPGGARRIWLVGGLLFVFVVLELRIELDVWLTHNKLLPAWLS